MSTIGCSPLALNSLQRVISAAWQTLGRFLALVTINSRRPYQEIRDNHGPALAACNHSSNEASTPVRSGPTCPPPGTWPCSSHSSTRPAPNSAMAASPKTTSNPHSSPPSSGQCALRQRLLARAVDEGPLPVLQGPVKAELLSSLWSAGLKTTRAPPRRECVAVLPPALV